jgi:ribosomal protein L37AE/L43A
MKLAQQLASKVTRAQAAIIIVLIIGTVTLSELATIITPTLGISSNSVYALLALIIVTVGLLSYFALRAVVSSEISRNVRVPTPEKVRPKTHRKLAAKKKLKLRETVSHVQEQAVVFHGTSQSLGETCPECRYAPMHRMPDGDWKCPRCGFEGFRLTESEGAN